MYQYHKDMFRLVRVDQIKVGDEISYPIGSPNSLYGLVEITEVVDTVDGIWLWFVLPLGLAIVSTEDRIVTVNEDRTVEVYQYYPDRTKKIMVLK